MKFLKLTLIGNAEEFSWVNFGNVNEYQKRDKGTIIYFVNNDAVSVRETPEEISAMLNLENIQP